MPNPIQVEERFQEVHAELETTLSIRYGHALLAEFIRGLDGDYRRYATYIVQLSGELRRYDSPLTWSGLDPGMLESQVDLFENVISELGEECAALRLITAQLRSVCLLLFGWLEDFHAADRYFRLITGNTLGDGSELDDPDSLIERIHFRLDQVLKVTQETRWLLQQLRELTEQEPNCLLVPVVEEYDGLSTQQFGRLRRLHVELHGEAQQVDELAREYRFIGSEQPVKDPENEAIMAARKLFEKHHPGVDAPPCKGSARYELSGWFHDGRSADLALGGLWYTNLEEASGRRSRYELNPSAALTGKLSSEGIVEAVGETAIRLKMEAAFFSWAEVLIVPSVQKRRFEKHLLSLRERFPGRRLLLLEAEYLEDIFQDRRVAGLKTESRIRYAIRRASERRYRAVGIPLVILLLGIIAWQIYGPIDKNPVTYRFDGSSWILENQYGQRVMRIPLNDISMNRYNPDKPITSAPLIQLLDIDKDGTNDVIYGEFAYGRQSDSEVSTVKAYSVEGDSVIWERTLELNYDFPRESGVTQREMLLREIQKVETENGTRLVMNANSFYYFPSVVFLVDPSTGEVEAEYLHAGHFRDMLVADQDADGMEELVLLGISNAHWMASMAVLDPGRMQGHSPVTRDYLPEGLERAGEVAYILIPKTVVGRYTNPAMKYNEGQRVYFDSPSQTLRVQIEEGRTFFEHYEGKVLYQVTFNSDLEPVGVGTSDIYDIVARDLYHSGKISFEPDHDYFESYKDSLLYWTGKEFVLTEEYFNR